MGRSLSKASFAIIIALLMQNAFALPQDRTTEAGEANITDTNTECTTYTLPLVSDHSAQFPQSGQKATLLPNDSVAQAKWQAISASIPDISVKGANGKSSGYDASDPDCWWTYNLCTTPKHQGVPADIVSVPEASTIGFGFDDGPYCGHNEFYDFLKAQNQKATFYYIGSNVYDWPLEAQRGLADGHEICVHTWSHPYMTSLQNEDAFAEIWYSLQIVKLVTGVTPTCWRPPYGDIDDRIRAIAHAMGLTTILWQYDSEDADVGTSGVTEADVDKSYQSFIATAKNGTFSSGGTIILEHEVDNYTVSKAMEYYPQLKEAFTHIVPVGVALNKTQPYVETNYSLPTFEQYIAGLTTVSATTSSSAALTSTSSDASTATTASNNNLNNSAVAITRVALNSMTFLYTTLISGLLYVLL